MPRQSRAPDCARARRRNLHGRSTVAAATFGGVRELCGTCQRDRGGDSFLARIERFVAADASQPHAIPRAHARAAIARRATLAHGLGRLRNFLGLWRGHGALRLARARMGRPPHRCAEHHLGAWLWTLVGAACGGWIPPSSVVKTMPPPPRALSTAQ